MHWWLRKVVGGVFIASSVLGLIGLPADIPTWFRCARYGGSKCPDVSTLWPLQIDGAVLFNTAFLLVGILLLWPATRLPWPLASASPTPPPPPPQAPPPARPASVIPTTKPPGVRTKQDRVIVDVEPAYLLNLYKDHTSLQGQKLAEPYIGKWMQVSGPIGDVGNGILTFANIEVTNGVYMMFDKHAPSLAVLRKGQIITVLGRIDEIKRFDVTLVDCEIVG